jgi:hypothetical protein
MIRTISSSLTILYKFVYPAGWTFVLVGSIIEILFAPTRPPWDELLLMVLACGLFSRTAWWCLTKLKRVRLDGEALYISNYAGEIKVPLTEVTGITEDRTMWNGRSIKVMFKDGTEFGSSVEFIARFVFIPAMRVFLAMPHPVIAEIQAAAEQAKKNMGHP